MRQAGATPRPPAALGRHTAPRRAAPHTTAPRCERRCPHGAQDYAQISERVDTEMVRFQGEKLGDFKHMMSNFIAVQIEYSQKLQNVWRDVMPHIDAIDADSAP